MLREVRLRPLEGSLHTEQAEAPHERRLISLYTSRMLLRPAGITTQYVSSSA